MKVSKLIISLMMGFVLILNAILFFILFQRQELLYNSIKALEESSKELQAAYNGHIEDTGENLNDLADTIKQIQEEARKSDFFKHLPRVSPVSIKTVPRESYITPQPSAVTPGPQENTLYREDLRLNGLFSSGKEALKAGNYTQAKRAFKELLYHTPPLWEAHLYYIEAAYYENPGRAARDRELKELLENLPEELNARGKVSKLAGLLAMENGEYTRGLTLIKKSLARNPEDRALLLRLGTGAFAYKDYETCIASLVKAGPQEAEDIYTLGRAYQELKQWEAALYQFNFCLVVDGSFFRAYKAIGQIKKETGAYREAVDAFTKYRTYRKDGETLLALKECTLALETTKTLPKKMRVTE